MKLITRDTDYAIRALCFIAQNKEKIIPVPQLAKELQIPHPFLRKILQALNKKRILKSFKGQDGGFALALPADKIFVVDLIEIFQRSFKVNNCLLKKYICPDVRTCLLKQKLGEIERLMLRELSAINIASLLN